MNKLSRAALAVLLCALLSSCAVAQEDAGALEAAEPLRGSLAWGEGDTAVSLAYALPQFDAHTESDAAINAHYQAMAQQLEAGEPDADEDALIELDYEITHSSERYVSVALYRYMMGGVTETQTLSADTFARDGVYAGQPVTLTQVLGLEEDAEGESQAELLAVELVWQIVQRDSQNMDRDYLDGLTRERVAAAFTPETDFYLDADGNVVFFIQSGVIAGEVAGLLLYPFSPAEMLSALAQ